MILRRKYECGTKRQRSHVCPFAGLFYVLPSTGWLAFVFAMIICAQCVESIFMVFVLMVDLKSSLCFRFCFPFSLFFSTSLSACVSILFLCFVLFISTIYGHRITECCVCFYADPSLYIRNSMWPTEQHFPSRIRFISVDTIKLSTY